MPKRDEVPKIDVYDSASVKRTLDDRVMKIVKDAGYEEDFYWSNLKLSLMGFACIVALIAQFYPLDFPDNKMLLLACCVLYFTVNSILQAIITFVEKDVIIRTNFPHGKNKENLNLIIRTKFPRYQEIYTVVFELFEDKTLHESVRLEQSVGRYFTKKGQLVKDTLEQDVQKSLKLLKKKV